MDATVNISPERFAQGLTIHEYLKGVEQNKDLFVGSYDNFKLKPEDVQFFRDLGLDLNVLALSEDWCGDATRYVPVLAHIVEAIPNWEVRVFYRDQNPDLADVWLKDGKQRAIPVVVFFDKQMSEIAHWVEKPAAVHGFDAQARQTFADDHPDLPDAALPVDDMSDSTRALYITFIRQFRITNRPYWQQLFVDELKAMLKRET